MALRRFPVRTLAKVIGFTLASLALTAVLAVRIGNLRLFSDTYRLEAEFANASGVFKGDAVKLAGVDVGRVEETRIEDGRAIVGFNVDRDVVLTTESVVGIRWRNVLGQRFLYVYPGDGQGRRLDDGDRIPVSRTLDAGDLGEFLNRLGPILRAIDPDKANAFLDAMNTALAGNEATVRALLDDGAVLTTELGRMDRDIEALITSSDTIMAAYASQDDAIRAIIEDFDAFSGRLEGMTGDINALVENFAILQQELDRLLKENRGSIDSMLRNGEAVARTFANNRANLSTTLCTLPAGVAPYFITTSWGEWFNVRITEVLLRDSHGNVIVDQEELPQQRAGSTAPPFTGCDGETAPYPTINPGYAGLNEPPSGGIPDGGPSTGGGPAGPPSELPVAAGGGSGDLGGGGDLGDLVDFATGGGGGG
jgi:phospholipid/cholesterol/gamma-HCH transport system substrate-binding protein